MFREYDTFRLSQRLPDESVPVGTVGVVLMVLQSEPPVYEVEFPDETGRNLGKSPTYTIGEELMEST